MLKSALIAFCLIQACSATTFDLSDMGISYFPTSVSWSVTYMKLDRNLIPDVDYIIPYPNLSIFDMRQNLLTAFPNFTNVTGSLTEVYLSDNRIADIPAQLLDILINLRILDVGGNRLTTIPDVPGPGNSLVGLYIASNNFLNFPDLSRLGAQLENLSLANNSLTDVDSPHLAQVPALQYLDLSTNRLTSFPNLCLLDGNGTLTVSLYGNPLVCDRRMAYVKLAEMQGILSVMESLLCAKPPSLQYADWTALTAANLLDDYSEHSLGSLSCRVPDVSNMRCSKLTTMTTTKKASLVRCGMMCLGEPECLAFAYQNETCLLTRAQDNSSGIDGLDPSSQINNDLSLGTIPSNEE